jgi:hypothetical protein
MHFFDQYDATTFHGILRALLQGFPDVTLIRLLSKAPEGFDQKEWTMAASIASVNNIVTNAEKGFGPKPTFIFNGAFGAHVQAGENRTCFIAQAIHENGTPTLLGLRQFLKVYHANAKANSVVADELIIPVISLNKLDGEHIRILHINHKKKTATLFESKYWVNEFLSNTKNIQTTCEEFYGEQFYAELKFNPEEEFIEVDKVAPKEDIPFINQAQTTYLGEQYQINLIDCGPIAIRVLFLLLGNGAVTKQDFINFDPRVFRDLCRERFLNWKDKIGEPVTEPDDQFTWTDLFLKLANGAMNITTAATTSTMSGLAQAASMMKDYSSSLLEAMSRSPEAVLLQLLTLLHKNLESPENVSTALIVAQHVLQLFSPEPSQNLIALPQNAPLVPLFNAIQPLATLEKTESIIKAIELIQEDCARLEKLRAH